jgi:hypothetical protein
VPQRRGKTEEAPKKDNPTGAGMLIFMHKSQEQTTRWMMEEQKQAEKIRAEDRQLAEERADQKEKI